MSRPVGTSLATGGLVRGLGLTAATALVAGNIIGSGIYVIPASLAEVAGPVSLLAWLIVAVCTLALTAVFADLASAYPISGGIQVYVQRAFGDAPGLDAAFLYWISCVIGNAAYLTAFVGYFAVVAPSLGAPLPAFLLAQALLWTLTAVNVIGVRAGGAVQVVTTVLKIAPLLVLSVALFASGSTANLHPFAPKGYVALFPAISLVAWIFLGSESVTIPAEEIEGSGRTIRKAAYAGFLLAVIVYVLVAVSLSLGLPSSDIAASASPLATAAARVLGPKGEIFVTLGALVSIVGVLNGWLLVTGRLPFAAARQGFCPAPFGRLLRATGTPAVSLIVSSALSGLLLVLYFDRTLLQAYNVIALAATATALVAIGGACAALPVLVRRRPDLFRPAQRARALPLAIVGIAIVVLMIAGSGGSVILLTIVMTALPLPFALIRRRRATGGIR